MGRPFFKSILIILVRELSKAPQQHRMHTLETLEFYHTFWKCGSFLLVRYFGMRVLPPPQYLALDSIHSIQITLGTMCLLASFALFYSRR